MSRIKAAGASLLLFFLLVGCVTTTTSYVDSEYENQIERLLIIVGFQSVYGPFGIPESPPEGAPTFLPDFEASLQERWNEDGIATIVSAVTVDGEVALVQLLSDSDPEAIILVEQKVPDPEDDATYEILMLDAPTGDRVWEGEYAGGDTDPDAVARRMHRGIRKGIEGTELELF
jgi:hypothetical protein